MQEAVASNLTQVEWLISPYNAPEHFVKQLSQCVYNYAPGNSVQHVLKIQVSENSFIEFSHDGISQSDYNPDAFKKLMKEPAFVDMKVSVKPVPERERRFPQNRNFQNFRK